jgi:hypothetical protein
MKKLTRDRVVPIISASVTWVIFGIRVSGSPGLPNSAIRRRILARRFSLELKSWSTRSACVRILRARRNLRKRSEKACQFSRSSRLVYSALAYVSIESTLVSDISPRVLPPRETPPAAVSVVLARSQSEA